MPLAFQSLSHGAIAFGFFNIDTDLLLLDRCFIFARDFCSHIGTLAQLKGSDPAETAWEVYRIEDPARIGDLMGAIHGIRLVGFIGEVYRRFPFPPRPEDFKQKPEGCENRTLVQALIEPYAEKGPVPVRADPRRASIDIGGYLFSKDGFHELLRYVWAGGYPGWRGDVRPGYVSEMIRAVEGSGYWLFSGFKAEAFA